MTEPSDNLKHGENKQIVQAVRDSSVSFVSLVLSSDSMQLNSQRWLIDRTRIIGRASADIELQIGVLSRRHAEVCLVNTLCQIRDLDSRNGSAVNGRMLSTELQILSHGDSILLAGKVEMRFHDPNATPFAPRLGAVRGCGLIQVVMMSG